MSNGARAGLLVGTVVVLVLAFVLLSPGDDDEPTTATTPAATVPATTPESPAEDPAQTATVPAATEPPAAEYEGIRVQAGKPQGGVQTITVKKGERVRIQVASQDTSDEVHVHGYDISRDLKAGDSVRFSFDADAEGVFEIELEDAHTQIGELVVEP